MALSDVEYLFAIGCSHMAGSEILGEGITSGVQEEKALATPGQIAKELQLNCINMSVPAASNGYIFRTVIDWVTKYLEAGRDPDKLLVFISWSTEERLEFTYPAGGKHYHWANGQSWEMIHGDGSGPNFKTWFKALQLYHTDFEFGRFCKIINILALDTFLKKHRIKYVQVSSAAKLCNEVWERPELCSLKSLFPFDTYFEVEDSFIEQYQDLYPEKFTPWFHADRDLHSMYAKKIVQYIRETYE